MMFFFQMPDMTDSTKHQLFLVGVAGGAACGKKGVCNEILRQLEAGGVDVQRKIAILSLSSFYRPLSPEEQALAAQGEFNFDHPDAFDWEKVLTTLHCIALGQEVQVSLYDFRQHSATASYQCVHKPDIVLLEGILILYEKRVRDVLSMMIFVDEDSDIRLARRTMRDVLEHKRDIDSVLSTYIKFVKPSFDDYIFPTKRYADIIIPRGRENQVAIDLIVKHIENVLAECSMAPGSPSRKGSSAPVLLSPEHKPQAIRQYREVEN